MAKILVISGHADLKISLANKTILETLAQKNSDIEIRKLDELYPDYKFDVKAEQEKLEGADVIIFQFPVYWYSVPGILKLYIDEIFLHGWAYGSQGKALAGKKIIFSATFGGPKEEYTKTGAFKHEPDEFFYFLNGFAALCNMTAEPPIYNCGMMYIEGVSNPEVKDIVIAKAQAQAKKILQVV